MTDFKHPVWERHLDTIAEELLRLSIACNVRLRDPGVVDRANNAGSKYRSCFPRLHGAAFMEAALPSQGPMVGFWPRSSPAFDHHADKNS